MNDKAAAALAQFFRASKDVKECYQYKELADRPQSALNPFKYNPEPHTWSFGLRLLRVLPSTDSGSEIKCELFHSTIRRHKLSYVALSYAWGDPADTVMIKVNSKPLLITRNLASALRTVRSLQIRTIWADAICIDQQNTLERNNQVGRMSEIYSCASYVLAYTGESIENCDEAFALLRKDRPSTRNTADYAQDIADRAKDEKTTPLWVALKLLYSRPWFRRCWVTQEVAVNKKVYVHAGEWRVEWSEVHFNARRIFEFQIDTSFQSINRIHSILADLDTSGAIGLGNVREQYQNHYTFKPSIPTLTLAAIADSRRASDATDPRDKIFSLLSFMLGSRTRVVADYTLTLEEVFQNAAEDALLKEQSICIALSRCAPSFAQRKLPSWCPDWTTAGPTTPSLTGRGYLVAFKAGAAHGRSSNFSFKGRELIISGVALGSVDFMSRVLGEDDGEDPSPMNVKTVIKQLGSHWPAGSPGENIQRTRKRRVLQVMTMYLSSYGSRIPFNGRDFEYYTETGPLSWNGSHGRGPVSTLKRYNICLTDTDLVAAIPKEARPGDRLCAFFGARPGYCLRFVENAPRSSHCNKLAHYELVGECFISDYMQGEVLTELKKGLRRGEEFHLV